MDTSANARLNGKDWRDTWRTRLALCFAGVLVGLSLAEILLRAAGFSSPRFYQFDHQRGWSLRPGVSGMWTEEGRSYVRISSQGLRDREHSIPAEPDTFRIAVLGDSFAEAMQVEPDTAFWSVLERRLAACQAIGGRRTEAINFGVSGYGTAQQLLTLRHEVWRFDPDLVLLTFLTSNDPFDNLRELDFEDSRPYFVVREGQLELDTSFRQSRRYRLASSLVGRSMIFSLQQSRVFQLVLRARSRLKASRWRAGAEERVGRIYDQSRGEAVERAWDLTFRVIERMEHEVRRRDRRFLLAVLSNARQVDPDLDARRSLAARLGVEDLFAADRRVEQFAATHGIPVLLTAPSIAMWTAKTGLCAHGFSNALPCGGHWNEHGHRLGGELIADAICESLAVEDRVGQF